MSQEFLAGFFFAVNGRFVEKTKVFTPDI